MFKLKSGDKSFEADATGSVSANQSDDGSITNSFFLEQINPDSTAEGKVVFDVSEKVANTKDKKLEITSSLFSTKSITVDLSDAKTSTKDKKMMMLLTTKVLHLPHQVHRMTLHQVIPVIQLHHLHHLHQTLAVIKTLVVVRQKQHHLKKIHHLLHLKKVNLKSQNQLYQIVKIHQNHLITLHQIVRLRVHLVTVVQSQNKILTLSSH